MSTFSVISDVTNTIIDLLRTNMNGLIQPDHISPVSPADVEATTAPYLSVFLYRISENEHLKYLDMPCSDAESTNCQPLTLKLFYLLSAYGGDSPTQQQMLGRAMQVLHDNSIVSGTLLLGELSGTAEELNICIDPLSIDDLNKLWSLFGSKPYKTSIGYRVSPILIDSTNDIQTERIIEKSLNFSIKKE